MKAPKRNTGHPIKRTLLAAYDLERLNFNPIEEIHAAMTFAKEMTLKGGNWGEKGTDQAQWSALWMKGALELASFKHPKLSAVAVTEIAKEAQETAAPLTTQEAIRTLIEDPFSPKNLKVTAERVIDAMDSNIEAPALPLGGKNE